ncbi:PIG-L family deacetylase [Deinococcus peraridilitoris]|uniref:PIG-L family deacetylase n=1 Tax=Deinococcus peraridilitoris TaxID=432329 RepID=UPI0012FC4221|nr:PIG-L family deacetylase [Deinococcus peraridilitoris]
MLARRGAVLLIAPHPDDETLGAGGVLQDAIARGREVWVAFVTNGDAFPWGTHWRWRWRGGRQRAQQQLAWRPPACAAAAGAGTPA